MKSWALMRTGQSKLLKEVMVMQQYHQMFVFGEFSQTAFDNADYGQENTSQHVTKTVIYRYCGNGEFNQHVLPQMSSELKV